MTDDHIIESIEKHAGKYFIDPFTGEQDTCKAAFAEDLTRLLCIIARRVALIENTTITEPGPGGY